MSCRKLASRSACWASKGWISLPGRAFSALHLICIMYAGFKRIEPGMDIGVDLTQFISTSGWKTGMNALPAAIRHY